MLVPTACAYVGTALDIRIVVSLKYNAACHCYHTYMYMYNELAQHECMHIAYICDYYLTIIHVLCSLQCLFKDLMSNFISL